MTSILPVSANKGGGGGKSPTLVTLTGDIMYHTVESLPGSAHIKETKRSWTGVIGVEGKNQPRYEIAFHEKWPSPFGSQSIEAYKTFINIYAYKDGTGNVRVTISHETDTENYVMWCLGEWTGDFQEGLHIEILDVTTSFGGTIDSDDFPIELDIEVQ